MIPWFRPSASKKLGYLRDQRGIYLRYEREYPLWNSHLQHSAHYIQSHIAGLCRPRVAVLGSGWLLDVPTEFLIEHCAAVYFIDIVHPPQIVHRYRNHPHLHFVEHDLTGGLVQRLAQQPHNWAGFYAKQLTEDLQILISQGFTIPVGVEADYFISLNLLSQLDGIPADYLRQRFRATDEQLLPLRRFVQQLHLQTLPTSRSLLIADTREHVDTGGGFQQANSLLYITLPLNPETHRQWMWQFDHSGNYYPKARVNLEVHATTL